MFGQIDHILSKISIQHLNILFLLGLALFGGAIGGRIFQKLKIPQVVGYIAIGIIIGESGLKIVGHDIIMMLQPFSYFALGLIGFMIGGELKKEVFLKYGKQFINILLLEGIGAFLAVSIFVGFVGGFLFVDFRFSWALGLLLGAIASATAPAATTEVLREYKTQGPLTRIVLGVVAMDDGLALLLFAIASSVAGSLIGNLQESVLRIFTHPIYEIGGSIVIGALAGLVLNKFLIKYAEEARLLAFSIGAVLIVLGLALAVHLDMLLAAMTLGVVVVNFMPRKSKEVFKLVEGFTPPIFVLFFVLVGAKLNFAQMKLSIIIIACIYLISRTAGKAIGSNFGARISKAPKTVQKYIPFCLFSQAGVAIGLSILASHFFPGELGNAVIIIITASTFVLEIIGPPFVRLAVNKAGEVGLNITEEDLMQKLKANQIMDKNPPLIYENTPVDKIISIFSESPNLYYPVVDNDKRLLGIITVDNIKNTLAATGLSNLLLAVDLIEPAVASAEPKTPISEVRGLFAKYNLEYLPVVDAEKKVIGFIERRMVYKIISTKVMELQRKIISLEKE